METMDNEVLQALSARKSMSRQTVTTHQNPIK